MAKSISDLRKEIWGSTDNELDVLQDWSAQGLSGADIAIGTTQPAIVDATGGVTIDAEARTAINAALAVLREYGMISP